jgi:hypothetical protein
MAWLSLAMAFQEFKELKVGQEDMKHETANRICVLATGVVSSRDGRSSSIPSGLRS